MVLPHGRYYTLAWTIPDAIGGLTSAMLQRSRAFARLGGVTMDVLTFDDRVDYATVEQGLREQGELVDGMRIVNLWDWFREHEVRPAALPLGEPPRAFTPLSHDLADQEAAHPGGVDLNDARLAADGKTVLQVDHRRRDGSLVASDRRDTVERGVLGGRAIVVCDRQGRPVRSWATSWSLYRWWLDRLTRGDRPCFLIADSKPVSRFLHTYRRPDRTTVHVVHGSHLAGNIGPWGRLRPSGPRCSVTSTSTTRWCSSPSGSAATPASCSVAAPICASFRTLAHSRPRPPFSALPARASCCARCRDSNVPSRRCVRCCSRAARCPS